MYVNFYCVDSESEAVNNGTSIKHFSTFTQYVKCDWFTNLIFSSVVIL